MYNVIIETHFRGMSIMCTEIHQSEQEIKSLLLAWLGGAKVEFREHGDNVWHELDSFEKGGSIAFNDGFKYRLKKATVRIGDYNVPEPERVAPDIGQYYYITSLSGFREGDNERVTWEDCSYDISLLRNGFVHLTRDAAELHARALISLTGMQSPLSVLHRMKREVYG